ncbi:MAG: RNA polymerase sigma factor [Planctomycetota bacterium]|jgi:DNA-directed RNA polymerase specialized sigma24 family protein
MRAGEPVTEKELDEAFRADPEFGLVALDADFRKDIGRCIKSVGWSFDSHEIWDVYQQVLLELVEMVRKGTVDLNQPLLPLAKTIARRRAIDHLRRKGHRLKRNLDDVLETLAEKLTSSNLNLRWRYLDRLVQKEFRAALMEEVSQLPHKQRVVAEARVNHFEDGWEAVKEEVSRVTGKQETVVAVKSAWRDAKETLRDRLTRRKFNFLKPE